jgi:hypothetical protein
VSRPHPRRDRVAVGPRELRRGAGGVRDARPVVLDDEPTNARPAAPRRDAHEAAVADAVLDELARISSRYVSSTRAAEVVGQRDLDAALVASAR